MTTLVPVSTASDRATAASDRAIATTDRATATMDRSIAASDRASAASDCSIAASDRASATSDRASAASDRASASLVNAIDDLSMTYGKSPFSLCSPCDSFDASLPTPPPSRPEVSGSPAKTCGQVRWLVSRPPAVQSSGGVSDCLEFQGTSVAACQVCCFRIMALRMVSNFLRQAMSATFFLFPSARRL